jgi:hypothetical protein
VAKTHRALPQKGEGAAREAPEAAARQQLKKKRTPRRDWPGVPRRIFALDTF